MFDFLGKHAWTPLAMRGEANAPRVRFRTPTGGELAVYMKRDGEIAKRNRERLAEERGEVEAMLAQAAIVVEGVAPEGASFGLSLRVSGRELATAEVAAVDEGGEFKAVLLPDVKAGGIEHYQDGDLDHHIDLCCACVTALERFTVGDQPVVWDSATLHEDIGMAHLGSPAAARRHIVQAMGAGWDAVDNLTDLSLSIAAGLTEDQKKD